jgi:hypothetical protein
MGKHKQTNSHLYIGVGGALAVSALVLALTFGLSGAQDFSGMPPPGGDMPPPPSGGTFTPPPGGDGGNFMPPPNGGTYTPPPSGGNYMPPPNGTMGNQFPMGSQPTTGGQYPMPGSTGTYGNMTNMPDCAAGTMPTPTAPCRPSGDNWNGGQNQNGNQFNNQNQTQTNCGQGMHFAQGMGCVRDMTEQEKRGSADQWNQNQNGQNGQPNGQNNQPFMNGQPNGMNGQQFQPQWNQNGDFQKMQDERNQKDQEMRDQQNKQWEEQQAKNQEQMNAQKLKDIKRGVKDATKGLDRASKELAKFEKKGCAPSAEVVALLAKTKEDISTLAATTDPEDVDFSVFDGMRDLQETMMESMQAAQQCVGASQVVKQLQKEVTKLAKKTSTKAIFKAILAEAQTAFDDLNTDYTACKAGDSDACESVFEKAPEVKDVLNKVGVLSNLKKVKSEMKRLVSGAANAVKGLKKLGFTSDDVSSLNDGVTELKTCQADASELVDAGATTDLEEISDKLDECSDLYQSLMDGVDELSGQEHEYKDFGFKMDLNQGQMNYGSAFQQFMGPTDMGSQQPMMQPQDQNGGGFGGGMGGF